MPRPHPLILITEYDTVKPRAAAPAVRLIQPAYLVDWTLYSSVTFMLRVASTVGAPTAFALKPRIRFAMPNTSGFQFTKPDWFELSQEQLDAHVLEKSHFPTITAPGTYTRTITRPPQRMSLDLGEAGANAIAFTGGTDPGLKLSLMAFTKEA